MKTLTALVGILTLTLLFYSSDLLLFSEPVRYLVIVGYIITGLYLFGEIIDSVSIKAKK